MTAILLLLNYANASLALPELIRSPSVSSILSTIFATAVVCIAGFVVGYAIARYARVGHEILWPFMLGVGMKNTGMALVLAGIVLEDKSLAIFAVLIFTLMQHLACGVCFRVVSRTQKDMSTEN